jgi:hypothetical protein
MDAVLKTHSEIYDQFNGSRAGPEYFFEAAHSDQYAAYYTSMYLIQDTGEAVCTHMCRGFSTNPMAAYLEFWGVMQAVVIQQDAIKELYNAVVGLNPVTTTLSGWRAIRDIRNLCAGHPAKRSVGVPTTQRAFMGRDFGDYPSIHYEVFEEGSAAPKRPSFNLKAMLQTYDAEAAEVLKGVLSTLKARWP